MSALSLPDGAPAKVGLSAARLDKLDQRLQGEIANGKLPGAVVMIARRGHVAYTAAIGARDPASGAPMTDDSLFRIFSMTKPLTSVVTMALVEDGVLQLPDPVAKYLPAFGKVQVNTHDREPARPARPMTVHDLLIHASGVVYGARCTNPAVRRAYADLGIPLNPRGISPGDFAARLAAAPLANHPGTVWEYGNSTDLLGLVIEAATGQRLGQIMAKRIFAPLGMADTGFVVPAGSAARLAQPFDRDPVDGGTLDRPDQTYDATIAPQLDSGGAGAISTAADYCRFAQMMLNGGALGGQRVLSRKTVEWMTADHLAGHIAAPLSPGDAAIQSPGFGFGLGVAVRLSDGQASVPGAAGSYFWSGTAGTLFWVDPREQLVALYMTQAPGLSRQFYRRLFIQLVYQAIDD